MYYSLVKRFAENVFAIRCFFFRFFCFCITFVWHTIIASLSLEPKRTPLDRLNVMHLTLMYANRISKGNGGKEWQKRTNIYVDVVLPCSYSVYVYVHKNKHKIPIKWIYIWRKWEWGMKRVSKKRRAKVFFSLLFALLFFSFLFHSYSHRDTRERK